MVIKRRIETQVARTSLADLKKTPQHTLYTKASSGKLPTVDGYLKPIH